MPLFGTRGTTGAQTASSRGARHSSGWAQLLEHLRTSESLRILDIGPTSAGNINFITGLGHSVYMANLVDEAARPEYGTTGSDGETTFDASSFLVQNLDFAGRRFNVVLFWDTADFLPVELVQPIVDRLHEVMEPDGRLLAYFHNKPTGDETHFSRYHLSNTQEIAFERVGGHPLVSTYTNRLVENLFHAYQGYKFLLAKDALREVIITR